MVVIDWLVPRRPSAAERSSRESGSTHGTGSARCPYCTTFDGEIMEIVFGKRSIMAAIVTIVLVQAQDQHEYVDPARRFRFMYPSEFGTTVPGTNDGFQDRVAAIRFSVFSNGI